MNLAGANMPQWNLCRCPPKWSLAAILLALLVGCGDSTTVPVAVPGNANPILQGDGTPTVSVTLSPVEMLREEFASTGTWHGTHVVFSVAISNTGTGSAWILDDPGMPYLDVTAGSLTLRWTIQDPPLDILVTLSPPLVEELLPGQTITRRVALDLPLRPTNHWGLWPDAVPTGPGVVEFVEALTTIPDPIAFNQTFSVSATVGWGPTLFGAGWPADQSIWKRLTGWQNETSVAAPTTMTSP